jgi:hypothetical protein
VEGLGVTAFTFTTKAKAVEVGRAEAMKAKVEHIIKNENG